MKITRILALFVATWASASAAVILSDNFDDGDVSDWTQTTNYVPGNGTTTVAVDNSGSVSPPNSMRVFLNLPGGDPSVFNIFVRASKDFTTTLAVDHTLALQAQSSPCQGCVVSYEVLVDGNLLTQTNFTGGFEPRNFNLAGLTPGVHTLTLGMFTTVANNGTFNAWFDDVVIRSPETSGVPEPSTAVMLLAGLALVGALRRSAAR